MRDCKSYLLAYQNTLRDLGVPVDDKEDVDLNEEDVDRMEYLEGAVAALIDAFKTWRKESDV